MNKYKEFTFWENKYIIRSLNAHLVHCKAIFLNFSSDPGFATTLYTTVIIYLGDPGGDRTRDLQDENLMS